MTTDDPGEHTRRIAALFDQLAEGYDGPALRYFSFAADELVARLAPAPGDKLLDIAAGTGAATLAAAQAVGPSGRVIAIDLSEGMLGRLERKLRQFGIGNVDVHVMNGARLDFRRDYFQHVICGFALFLMPDMVAALSEWRRVLRPGGQLVFSSFGAQAFEPMKSLFFKRLGSLLGRTVQPPSRLASPQDCRDLLESAGFCDVRVEPARIGYRLKDAAEWWEIVWFTPLRSFLRDLGTERFEEFRAAHLAEVEAAAGPEGLRLEVEPVYAAGRKP